MPGPQFRALPVREQGWAPGHWAAVRPFPALISALLLVACAAVPPPGIPVTGTWGGPHIGLSLDPAGGAIEYDCASGRLTEPLVPRPNGGFDVGGTHTPGSGGPDIEGVVLPTYRVRFTGFVRGDRMTMTGQVENGAVLGPFSLRRGTEPGIFRCL